MILHICEDNRFVAMAKNQFDQIDPGQHFFLVNSSDNKANYINDTTNIILKKSGSPEHLSVIESQEWKAVIFHNLNQKYKWNIIKNLPNHTLIIWFSWGSDIYMLPKLKNKLYLNYTKELIAKTSNRIFGIEKNSILQFILKKHHKQLKAISRINYCAPVIPHDIQLLNKTYHLNIKTAEFSYGDLDYYLGNDKSKLELGNNILIGNSGDFSNNHADVFQIVKKINTPNSKIIVPLSYGGSEKYRQEIKKLGVTMFAENFISLDKVIPLNEYRDILFSCSIAIMYHKRQQALGNIIMLLWMGVKLYFHNESPVYKYFKDNDLFVYQLDEIMKHNGITPLNNMQVMHNRSKLSHLYSKESVLNKTQSIVDLIP